jgi:type I site-specific restriction-modification system R (restriction) subunit
LAKQAIVEAILEKHDAATGGRRFNAMLATASINDAIEYFNLFKSLQDKQQELDPAFQPLNIACVFSPPAEGKDVQQIQEDLPQEKADNEQEPEKKKERSRPSSPTTTPALAPITASASSTSTIRMCKSASKISNFPIRTCPSRAAERSTSPSWWTCCSPALIPNT